MNPLLVLSNPSPSSSPKIINANLMFTEITGYQREELIDRELSKISPHLFINGGFNCFELFSKEERDKEGFINHKFNHLIAVEYSVVPRLEEGEWHIVFKLASASNMKLILLADEHGMITDYNLLAQTSFRDLQTTDAKPAFLTDVGLTNFTHQQYRRQNGFPASLKLGGGRMG